MHGCISGLPDTLKELVTVDKRTHHLLLGCRRVERLFIAATWAWEVASFTQQWCHLLRCWP